MNTPEDSPADDSLPTKEEWDAREKASGASGERKHPDCAVQGTTMTFAEFSQMNRQRCESPSGFNHQLDSWTLSDWFTAVLGELGEAANVAKKLNRYRDGIPGNKLTEAELREQLKCELADTFIYLDLTAQAAGFRLGDVVQEVFDRKSAEIGYQR